MNEKYPFDQRRDSNVDVSENENDFLERIRNSIHTVSVDCLDELAPHDVDRLARIKAEHWTEFDVTGDVLEDLASLKAFCVMDLPQSATLPKNDSWLPVLAHEHLVAFRRLIGATNEDSARSTSSSNGYPYDCRYACQWRRIDACSMICATNLPCSIQNIPTQKGFPIGGKVYEEIVNFIRGMDDDVPSSSNKSSVIFPQKLSTIQNMAHEFEKGELETDKFVSIGKRLKSSEKFDSSESETHLLLGNHLTRSNSVEQVDIESMKVVPRFDDSLLPKQVSCSIEGNEIVINTPRFAAFIPKKPSKVSHTPKKPIGKACPGFFKVFDGIKKRIPCVFEITARDSTNASVKKNGCWQYCYGCNLLSVHLVYKEDSNKRMNEKNMRLSKSGEKCYACKETEELEFVGSYAFCPTHMEKTAKMNEKNMRLSKSGEKCYACKETEELEFVGSYAFCPTHMENSAKNNAKNNGSDKSLKSLRDHYARKKARVAVEIPVIEAVNLALNHYAKLLKPISDWLLSEKVVIYDTESDGVGATNALEKTREYHFYHCSTKKHLNIWVRRKDGTPNPFYTHETAREQILSFIGDAEFLVAFEPPSNDRYRLKSLFGDAVYEEEIEPKVIDLKRTVVNRIFTTDSTKENTRIYLRGFTQPDVYENLLQVGTHVYPSPDYFLPIPDALNHPDKKCEKDVRRLTNLFLFFRSVIAQ